MPKPYMAERLAEALDCEIVDFHFPRKLKPNEHDLKSLRKWSGQTQQEVADYLCMSKHNYVLYENGERKPPNHVVIQLSKLYGVPISYLAKIIHGDVNYMH